MIKQFFKVFLCLIIVNASQTLADEGMWIPSLLKQLNEADMQKNGLKLSAEDIYSINKSSLKDAIVHFGGGCTGEMISSEGLLLTNHHCGYGQIQSHSSVEKDYLTDGFWAKDRSQELLNPGLTATFIIRIEDVTNAVLNNVTTEMSGSQRDVEIQTAVKSIIKEATSGSHYEAYIKPFYFGNEYYMFVTETFKDVRLVGAPPSSIGKFGGDTDNWMWPRHTGDFSLFRIYADANNKPAEYSADNKPYKPKHFLPISLKGIEENDFTMVFGFPGRTNQYLTSYGVDLTLNQGNPTKIYLRDIRLNIMEKEMKKSDIVRIKYSAKQASASNAYKKWKGESLGLKRLTTIEKKKKTEAELIKNSRNGNSTTDYQLLLQSYNTVYQKYKPLTRARDYYYEGALSIEILSLANGMKNLISKIESGKLSKEEQKKSIDTYLKHLEGFYKDYDKAIDKQIFATILKTYNDSVTEVYKPELLTQLSKKYKNDFAKYAEQVFNKSIFSEHEKLKKLVINLPESLAKIKKDPAFVLIDKITKKYETSVQPELVPLENQLAVYNREFVIGLRKYVTDKKYYPDANSTMRVAYGKVAGYEPKDGVYYLHYTTLEGIMEKEDKNIDEFVVSPKLKQLYEGKDYGQYADKNGEMRVAFCASNHTTGGNSGSPVINATGELIGTNFDRNWEGTMSDIMYDPEKVRNIVLDIRYTLFIIDKFAGAGYLINEMKLIQ